MTICYGTKRKSANHGLIRNCSRLIIHSKIMASSLDVMKTVVTASRSIFDSVGFKAECFQELQLQILISVEKMEKNLHDGKQMEGNFPGLFELEALSMIIKLWLRRIQQAKQDQRKTLQDFENKLYRVLSEIVEPYKRILTSNKSKDLTDLPMLQHYIKRLSEACDGLMKEKMKVNFQIPEEDRRRLDKHTVFVCSLLGLRLDFLDRLEEMPPETRDHQTLRYWIVNFLRNNNETLTSTEKNSLSYKEQLYEIGFDPLSSAVESILERAGSMEQHIEACEWAERRVQDEFKYNVLLSQRSKRLPFEIGRRAEWLEKDGVIVANVVTKKSESSMRTQSMLRKLELYDEQMVVLFRGTDHKSACDIMSGRGIHLGAGRKKRDFSSGAGFYLTKNLDDALSWACSTTVKPAILVFRVELDFLNRASKLNLNEGDGLTKWREIVNFFRLDKVPGNVRSSLSGYDLIEGKSATATRSGPTNGDVALMFEQNTSSYQMCLISKKFAEMFQKMLHSILFYDIS